MIRRTPLARSTTPVNKRRSKPRRVSVVRDQDYMDWLKLQACLVHGLECGLCDPCHTDKTNGASSKGSDASCVPLCRPLHNEMDGRLSTKIATKQAFAEKYGLDLAAEAAKHYRQFKGASQQ